MEKEIIAIISAAATIIVALIGLFGNWYLAIQNRKQEIEQKEYQFLLENLKGFWEYQNQLYTETLKVVSELVLNDDITSESFLSNYKRFWELYWSELPTCESREIESAMVGIKDLIYEKKHLNSDELDKLKALKAPMKQKLLTLAKSIKNSSILLEYSEKIKGKLKKSS